MAIYDPSVIATFADSLYAKAATIVQTYTAVGALAGACFGGAIGYTFHDDSYILLGIFIGAVFVGAAAWVTGMQKAFALRLQAQVALCQAQIEANTRRIEANTSAK
jgi:hypothetical protein